MSPCTRKGKTPGSVFGLLVLVVLVLVACEKRGRQPLDTPVSVSVEGQACFDEGGQFRIDTNRESLESPCEPLWGVTVTLRNADGFEQSFETDYSGRFKLGPVPLTGTEGDQLIVAAEPLVKQIVMDGIKPGSKPFSFREGMNEIRVALPESGLRRPKSNVQE